MALGTTTYIALTSRHSKAEHTKTPAMKNTSLIGFVLLLLGSQTVWAWGKRGHQIVGETAAQLVADGPDAEFMREKSFDFAYYANVPDFIWKRPKTYEREKPQHFIDLEIFERAFRGRKDMMNPFLMPRKDFEAKFPEIPLSAGRAFWRIREMNESLTALTEKLRDPKLTDRGQRQKLQEKWLVIAGTMAHYVGDLGMPLHVSDNYDGQLTNQKGIHHYFEEAMVDQLYPDINSAVFKSAKSKWPAFHKKHAKLTVPELAVELAKDSAKQVHSLLRLDRKLGRKGDQAKIAKGYRQMIENQLVSPSLFLAEIYSRQLGWKFDNTKFYFFDGEPEFIEPQK